MADPQQTVDLTARSPRERKSPDGHVAVCCSGGGIRSASFNLGALQELAARGVMEDVDTVCAVSGGSYIAASHAEIAGCSSAKPELRDIYAAGSPEEKWLRSNTRYLLPNAKVAFYGAVRLLFGIAINMLLLLAWFFLLGHVLGWFLFDRGLLGGLHSGVPFSAARWYWMIPLGLGALAAACSFVKGTQRPWSTVAWIALVLAAVSALGLLAAPRAIEAMYNTGLNDDGNVGIVVRGFGFASASGCEAARAAEPNPSVALCGTKTSSMAQTGAQAPESPGGQSGGFLVFIGALGALVRLAMGKLRGEQPGGANTWFGRAFDWVRRIVLPWAGTILVIVGLGIVGLRWVADGAVSGATGAEVAKVAVVFVALLLLRFVVDVNRTSMHGFYRDRLAFAYGITRDSPSTITGTPRARLSDLDHERARLVVCAAANVNVGIAGDEIPPGREAMSFTFTPDHVGLSARPPAGTAPEISKVPGRQDLRVDTATYERVVGHSMTLFDAVSLSGAAVSPVMGKMTRPALRFLFAVANVRLGLWLPNPRLVASAADPALPVGDVSFVDRLRIGIFRRRLNAPDALGSRLLFRASQPNLRLLLAEAFGHHRVRTSWMYITDGGHFENLGLVEALRRGATEVYVFDAAGDAVTTWSTVGQAIALARSELGITIDIEPETMVENGKVVRPYAHGTFTRTWDPTLPTGTIRLCKLGVWPGAPWDVQAYADRHPTFPTDSTVQQLYDDEEFEAYRALGRAAATAMLDADQASVSTTTGIGREVNV
jgi:hypothetical protein